MPYAISPGGCNGGSSDLDDLHRFQSRSDVAEYLLWNARTREETSEALDAKMAETDITKQGDTLSFAVELIATGEVIGDFSLTNIDSSLGRGEIGFVMDPVYAGRGYATEAGREVLRLAFETYGFHRVVGLCNGSNTASQRLMERLGMRREALFIQGEMLKGVRADMAVYAVLATEWSALNISDPLGLPREQ